MKRFEVDILGRDELVVRLRAQILNVVYEERIGKWLPDEKNYLCTAVCKPSDDLSSYTSCSSLY